MDPHQLLRLQEEQRKALFETDTEIDQIKQFREDYKALQTRLKSLPDKMTHDVMVPFGKFAFMPGQLVHTNEILVLLGDNWFCERSAKQASEIAGRRIKELDTKLKDLRDQRKLLEPRLGFTSDLQAELEGQRDVKEIVEVYDEEKEKLWDEQHRKNVKRYKESLKQNVGAQQKVETKGANSHDSDAALWSRLDELERLEAEKGEMDSDVSGEDSDDEDEDEDKRKVSVASSQRRVSWADKKRDEGLEEEEESDSDDDEDDNADGEDDDADGEGEEDEMSAPVKRTITFSHSQTPAILPHQVVASGDSSIQSPADIYKLLSPKPILKKTGSRDAVTNAERKSASSQIRQDKVMFSGAGEFSRPSSRSDDGGITPDDSGAANTTTDIGRKTAPSSDSQKAFTGLVVEKPVVNPSSSAMPESLPMSKVTSSASKSADSSSLSDEPPKRVSKFKASRMKQS